MIPQPTKQLNNVVFNYSFAFRKLFSTKASRRTSSKYLSRNSEPIPFQTTSTNLNKITAVKLLQVKFFKNIIDSHTLFIFNYPHILKLCLCFGKISGCKTTESSESTNVDKGATEFNI